MLTQGQIGDEIISRVDLSTRVIILFLIDGLSYGQFRGHLAVRQGTEPIKLEPCLVDVPTLTRTGFPNLIGHPPIAIRLFDLGFRQRLGFSYWSREDNDLTDQIFEGFPEVDKVGEFAIIKSSLRDFMAQNREQRMFVQLVRIGLDSYVHSQKRKPPIQAILTDILDEFLQLVSLCQGVGLNAQLYLTSDHGILSGSVGIREKRDTMREQLPRTHQQSA